jgi:hypothetical protein
MCKLNKIKIIKLHEIIRTIRDGGLKEETKSLGMEIQQTYN